MKIKQSFLIAVSVSFVFYLWLGAFDARAQNLPPITPAIDREEGPVRVVKLSNADQQAPVLATAEIRIGKRTHGSGFLTLKNVSGRPLLAARGEWEFGVDDGGAVSRGWNYGGGGFLLREGWKPGHEVTVPVSAPPDFFIQGPQQIGQVQVRITGVVFKDGTRWGDDGDMVYHRLKRKIEEMRYVIGRLQREPAPQLVHRLTTTDMRDFYAYFPSKVYQMLFRQMLLDDQGELRADAMSKLDHASQVLETTSLR